MSAESGLRAIAVACRRSLSRVGGESAGRAACLGGLTSYDLYVVFDGLGCCSIDRGSPKRDNVCGSSESSGPGATGYSYSEAVDGVPVGTD